MFGLPVSQSTGAIWDGMDAEGRAVTEAAADNSINAASEADIAKYQPIADAIVAKVVEEAAGAGVDAAAARQCIVDEMKKG